MAVARPFVATDHTQGIRLSSPWTPLERLFFPADCLLAAFLFVCWLFMKDEGWFLVLAAGFGVRSVVFWRRYWVLKDITIHGDTVHASSFARAVTFPLSSVAEVEVDSSGQRVVLSLSRPTRFGYRLAFAPRGGTVRDRNSLVAELRSRVTATRSKDPFAG
jgi:hypothetical protein